MLKSKLGFGPMSFDIIDTIFEVSQENRVELMLIPSLNQINNKSGYVCNTSYLINYIKTFPKYYYPQSNVKLCRDHCGIGFGGINNLDQIKQNIACDVNNGFDLIHIDVCYSQNKIQDAIELINYCKSLNPNIDIEIGTDENSGYVNKTPEDILKEIKIFTHYSPEFFVLQTGSKVIENYNSKIFKKDYLSNIKQVLQKQNISLKLKEHNADYLTTEEIKQRHNIIDAMNIAPQLGVIQTTTILNQCQIFGISTQKFINLVSKKKNWSKWTSSNDPFFQTILAGHYHYNSTEYQEIFNALSKETHIKYEIRNNLKKVLNHYVKRFS
jgi:hypothetical protein